MDTDPRQPLGMLVKRNAFAFVLCVLAILALLVYASGYRVTAGPRVVRLGTLVLPALPAGTTVYADQTRGGVARTLSDVTLALLPGNHSLLVDAPGAYPWSGIASVTSGGMTNVSPILVPKAPPMPNFDPTSAKQASAIITAAQLPSAASPLTLASGCALVRVDNNHILADGVNGAHCTAPTYLCSGGSCTNNLIFAPLAPIRAVIAYPGRQDALIVAYGDTVAVLGLDPLSPQFFAPLYKGTAPTAAPWSSSMIVVADGTRIFGISF